MAQRIDSRYTLHGEMLSRKEALEYFRSGYAQIFQRRLPGSGLTTMSMDSVNWGGNEFRSIVVAIRGNGAGSRGPM
jgi:hypothetical protein